MTRDWDDDETFYEEDEPVEKIMAIFERGKKGVTGPPLVQLVCLCPDPNTRVGNCPVHSVPMSNTQLGDK